MPKTPPAAPVTGLGLAAALLALAPAPAGQAQTLGGVEVLQERNMPLAAAQRIAQAAVEACADRRFGVTAAVVDRAGVLRALLRAERAGSETVAAARAKAFTSASLRNATQAVAEAVAANPAQRNLGQIGGFLLVGGGLPVRVAEEVIGAVGVSGAPTGVLDESCARTGLERVQSPVAAAAPSAAATAVAARTPAGGVLPLATALRVAQVAVESCLGRGFNVAAAVVDARGAAQALLRADRAGPHTPGASAEKAYTSVVLRDTTAAVVAAVAANPVAERRLNATPGILLLGGGVPIRVRGELVGAVGVGGAPSGQADEECARAGLAAAGLGNP